MAKPGRAYFVEGVRYAPSRFRRLSREKRIEGMVDWFGRHFEDPVHRTTYVSAEGGYIWNHGGPYDADDELSAEFGELFNDESLIAEAVDRIEEDGTTEWASSSDEYYDPPEEEDSGGLYSVDRPLPDFASEHSPENDVDYRQELVGRLDRLEAKLDAYAAQRARRGHNHPPELVDEELLSDDDLADAREAASTLRQEIAKGAPDEEKVEQAAGVIRRIGQRLWRAVETASSDVRSGIVGNLAFAGAIIAYNQREELARTAIDVAMTSTRWLQSLPSLW